MRPHRLLVAATLLALVGAAPAAFAVDASPSASSSAPAGARQQLDADLSVISVAGREVTLRMPLQDLAASMDATGPVTVDGAVVTVGGTAVPARASLDDPTADPSSLRPNLAVLALDTSGSMDGERIQAAQRAATDFVTGLPPDTSVALVTFADQARLVVAPTRGRQQILDAIAGAKANGDTALYDAVDLAATSIPPGTSARIVLLSDGADTSSARGLAAALRSASEQGHPIDVIALQPSQEQSAILERIADTAGGRVLTAVQADQLGTAFVTAAESFASAAIFRVSIPEELPARGAPVSVTARIGGLQVSGSTTLPDDASLAAQPAAPEVAVLPAAIVPPSFDRSWLVLAAFAFLAIIAAGLAWVAIDRGRRHRRRMQQVTAYQVATTGAPPSESSAPGSGWIDRLLERSGRARSMRSALGAAEIPMSPGTWLLVRIGISVLLAVLGVLLLGPVLGVVLGLAVGWLGTWALVRARSSRRQQSFARDLPDFLLLLASALRGGLSFSHALEAVALDGKGEVPRQMRRVLRQVQVGTLLDEALMECADRMDSEDLRWTVTALSIQREVGGNLSTILDNAAATIKAREELRREVQTLSAEGRLSGYILIGLPLGVMAFLAIIRRSYVELLWTTALGIVMLALMGVLMVLGWFWMRAIVRITP